MPDAGCSWSAGQSPPDVRRALRLTLVLVCAALAAAARADPAPRPERAAELVRMVRQDCGSCHGMRLTGGLGPALTPDTLRGKPADSLAATILHGRPGSAMPPWRPFLSAAEADWIVKQLQAGFPDAR